MFQIFALPLGQTGSLHVREIVCVFITTVTRQNVLSLQCAENYRAYSDLQRATCIPRRASVCVLYRLEIWRETLEQHHKHGEKGRLRLLLCCLCCDSCIYSTVIGFNE